MAGHSQFKNIMHRKGRQDAIRAKLFAKLAREITVAAKNGLPDPSMNARLRLAIQSARAENMPKDNIERAIKKSQGGDARQYEAIRYEGYGPGGVAVIVEALTDNRNRTAGSVRSIFAKYHGNLGESNSVSFLFDRIGQILYTPALETKKESHLTPEKVFDAAIEAGAQDANWDGSVYTITCDFQDLASVSEVLEEKLGIPSSVSLIWQPKTEICIDEETAQSLMKLIQALEDDEDVQSVFSNFEVSEEILQRLAG